MNKNLILVIIVILIVGVAYFVFSSNRLRAPVDENMESDEMMEGDSAMQDDTMNDENRMDDSMVDDDSMMEGEKTSATVTYTDAGYSPGTVTIKKGGTVTWVNDSSRGMWTASAVHPTHTVYSGTSLSQHCPDPDNTSFDSCGDIAPGESWAFTFDEAGEWGYHNHTRASHFGRVIVQ